MPTYAYACTACEHRFEAQQAFSDASLTECPECAGRLRKVFSSVGIVFKGSGFYRTDSRGKNGASEAAASSPGTAAKDGAAASSSAAASSASSASSSSDSSGSSGGSSGSSSTASTPKTSSGASSAA